MADGVDLILASGSRFRRAMLERAGIKFRVAPADVDEEALKATMLDDDPDMDAALVAETLACAKAEHVSRIHPNALVIGADQVLVCGGEIFSKPPTIDAARAQLKALRGLTHALPTAVVLARSGEILWRHVDEPQMTMRAFSDAFLDAYVVAEGQVLCETVGAYQFEGRGAQLFEVIEGDQFSIVGLPLLPLLEALRTQGVITS
jgi:septum formation protein